MAGFKLLQRRGEPWDARENGCLECRNKSSFKAKRLYEYSLFPIVIVVELFLF